MPPKKSNLNNARSRDARRKRLERARLSANQMQLDTKKAVRRIRRAENRIYREQHIAAYTARHQERQPTSMLPWASIVHLAKTSPYPSVPKLLEMDLNNPTSSELDVKPLTYNPHFALNTTSQSGLDHRLLSSQNEDSPDMKNSSPTRFNNEDSSFFQFFRSIHSDYLELSAKNQRLFKRKCFDILCNLLEEEGDANRPISNSSHQDNILKLTNLDDISEENIDIKPLVENGYILPN